jgi:hypothetical protein
VGNLQVSRGTCMVEDGVLTDIIERRNVHATNEGYDADDGLEPETLSPLTTVSMNLWGFQPSIVPYMHKAIEAHNFAEESEIQLSTFVGQLLKTERPRFDVLQTRSRCIGVTHAQDLAVAQLLVRLEIEVGQRPEYAFAEGSTTTPPAVD